jgi:hypothetical protein
MKMRMESNGVTAKPQIDITKLLLNIIGTLGRVLQTFLKKEEKFTMIAARQQFGINNLISNTLHMQ